MGPPKTICLEVFMVNDLVFRWPKPLLFMVLGAYGRISTPVSGAIAPTILDPFSPPKTNLKHPVLNGEIPILEIHHGNPAEASKSSGAALQFNFWWMVLVVAKKTHRMQLWQKNGRFWWLTNTHSILMATVTTKVLANLNIFLQGGPLPVVHGFITPIGWNNPRNTHLEENV